MINYRLDDRYFAQTLDDAGILTISGTGAMYDYTDSANSPWHYDKDQITSVVIEVGVTTVGEFAFSRCSSLTDVYYTGTEEQWEATEGGSKTVIYQPGDEYTEDADITLHAVRKMPGDVNGDGAVGTKDFVTLMRYCAGDRTITFDPNALDIDNNGEVETLDFITLMQFIAGKEIQILLIRK